MKNARLKIISTLCLSCLIVFAFLGVCLAANFSLSVTPYEGGFNLNFDNVSPASGRMNKEVVVRVNSDIAKQYRVTQTMFEPLSSLEGATFPSNNFLVYGIRGSNRSGILLEQPIPVGMGRQVIYTSDAAGPTDSFTLVFDLFVSPDTRPGSYRGRIGFTLEAINATQPPVTAFLNVFAEVKVESSIEIRNLNGSKNIRLKVDRGSSNTEEIGVNIRGAFGKQYRLLQLADEQPVAPDGTFLDWEVVKFSGSGAQRGMAINEASGISGRQQLIYTSSLNGEGDSFALAYTLGDVDTRKAGIYRSRIKYIFEGVGFSSTRLIDTLNLEVDIPRVFELAVTPELGGRISFRDLRPQQPPKIQEVIFEVKSNIGRRYQVTQNTASLLTDKEGYVIPKDNFILQEESLDTRGNLKYLKETQVQEGQMVLFVSDNEGSPAKFKVIYELTVPRDIRSGDYYTNFTYSVSEI